MSMKTHVEVIRLNGGSTEMTAGTERTFKRILNLPWCADGFVVRQIQVGSLNAPVNCGVYTISTNMMGSEQEIACFTEGTSLCPQTIFSSPVKSGTYNFSICQGYIKESNHKSVINTDFDNDVVLIIEFVKFK